MIALATLAVLTNLAVSAELEIGVSSRQTKFGSVEKDGAVGVVEGEVGAYGISVGAEWVYDHEGGRELSVGPRYEYEWDGIGAASVGYVYEAHPERGEPCTQYVVPRIAADCLLRPSIEAWYDVAENSGAAYYSLDFGHGFGLTPRFSLDLDAGVGLGNARMNRERADFDAFGFKDLHATAALKYVVTENFGVKPWVSVIHRFRHGGEEDTCGDLLFVGGACAYFEF